MNLTTRLEPTRARMEYVLAHLREADRRELLAQSFVDDPVALAPEFLATGGLRFCVGNLGYPVAFFGVSEVHPGLWQAWAFATDDFPKVARAVTAFIKRALIPTVEGLGAHRCQAVAYEGNEAACRWLVILGAKNECIMQRYGRGGENFVLYRWDRRV